MSPVDYLPFVVAIVFIIMGSITIIVHRALEYRERVDMLKQGYVPKGYQPRPRASEVPSAPKSDQPAALPPAPWGAQQWQEGVPTSRYMGELAKDDASTR